jgi:UDP-N-acetylglucosamine--N-acetylmuramyl-(pentapeptide) pyrophosphoryl-undecaprenol N-acetylglucosamine transferase
LATRSIRRIIIAGGGTGGHVQPAVATVQALRGRAPLSLLWVGSHQGLERRTAESENIPFRPISTGKLRRYFSLQTPVDAARIPVGILQAYRIIKQFRPEVVFGTGGFVSVPSIIAARLAGVPSLSHEQTATVGLATRINAWFCDVVALSYESSHVALPSARACTVVTGNPVRPEILNGNADHAIERFQLSSSLPLIYITGGALGAHAINTTVREILPQLLTVTQVIHQCGPSKGNGDYPHLVTMARNLPAELRERYTVVEFLGPELADVYAAATLVIGRAGAGTVAELAALGKPSILIPLPGAGGDEQTRNARILVEAGAGVLLPQHDLTPNRLLQEILELIGDRPRLGEMARLARTRCDGDAAGRLADLILSLARTPAQHPALVSR